MLRWFVLTWFIGLFPSWADSKVPVSAAKLQGVAISTSFGFDHTDIDKTEPGTIQQHGIALKPLASGIFQSVVAFSNDVPVLDSPVSQLPIRGPPSPKQF